jgi:hypothetical protein
MIYEIKNGLRVCEEGSVVIDNVKHYIKKGFVICNPSLNGRSWNTTKEKEVCKECHEKTINKQLKIF